MPEPFMAHVAPGGEAEIAWTFNRPRTFDFGCLVAGHYESGIVGSIDVLEELIEENDMNATRRSLLFAAVAAAVGADVRAATPAATIEVWKSPDCGCCAEWVRHLEANGFRVKVSDTGNNAMRARLGMPAKLGSCHTAQVGGYAIEGHVPAADIQRLLAEKPRATGLAVPGMPIGSPGMEQGDRREPYDVLLVLPDGSTRVFQSHR
jgi:hypothetical protein